MLETCSMSLGMLKIMSFEFPSWRTWSFTLSHRRTLCGSGICFFSINWLTGLNVSNPFAADHGKPAFLTLSCRLRAVMSIARAAQYKRLH